MSWHAGKKKVLNMFLKRQLYIFFLLSGKCWTTNCRAQVSIPSLIVCLVRRWYLVAIPNSSLGPPLAKPRVSSLYETLGTLVSVLRWKRTSSPRQGNANFSGASKRAASFCCAQPVSLKIGPASPRLCGLGDPQKGTSQSDCKNQQPALN